MYSLRLPPELVSRLYLLRERHDRGPIRRQVVRAIERYLTDAEAQLNLPSEPGAPETDPTTPARPSRSSR